MQNPPFASKPVNESRSLKLFSPRTSARIGTLRLRLERTNCEYHSLNGVSKLTRWAVGWRILRYYFRGARHSRSWVTALHRAKLM